MSFESIQNQTKPNQNQNIVRTMVLVNFWHSAMLGIKKHVLKVGNLMVALDKSFEPIQNQTKPNQNKNIAKTMV